MRKELCNKGTALAVPQAQQNDRGLQPLSILFNHPTRILASFNQPVSPAPPNSSASWPPAHHVIRDFRPPALRPARRRHRSPHRRPRPKRRPRRLPGHSPQRPQQLGIPGLIDVPRNPGKPRIPDGKSFRWRGARYWPADLSASERDHYEMRAK